PVSLRRSIIERIEREIQMHKEHGNGHLIFKINSLVDPATIEVLYRASQAGVRIDLIVRGICCLRPGIPGISETIRVRSLVGRFLEHSRVYYFGNGGNPEIYLGSADLMQRNLDARVETLFPIEDPLLGTAIRTSLLDRQLADTSNARELLPVGCYERVRPEPGEPPFDSQAWSLAHPLVDLGGDDPNNTIRAMPSGA
nr:RNA degradosome polyphosphate kinase [Ktedonobacteraceae bacterium]